MKSCTLIEKETQWMEIFIFHYVLLNELNCTEWKYNDIFLVSNIFLFIHAFDYITIFQTVHAISAAIHLHTLTWQKVVQVRISLGHLQARLLCSISSRDLIKKTTFIRDLSYLISILMLFDTVMSLIMTSNVKTLKKLSSFTLNIQDNYEEFKPNLIKTDVICSFIRAFFTIWVGEGSGYGLNDTL